MFVLLYQWIHLLRRLFKGSSVLEFLFWCNCNRSSLLLTNRNNRFSIYRIKSNGYYWKSSPLIRCAAYNVKMNKSNASVQYVAYLCSSMSAQAIVCECECVYLCVMCWFRARAEQPVSPRVEKKANRPIIWHCFYSLTMKIG